MTAATVLSLARPGDDVAYLGVAERKRLQWAPGLKVRMPDGALQLGVAEQELTSPQVARALVDRSHRRSQAVSAVGGRVQTGQRDPITNEAAVRVCRNALFDTAPSSASL